VEKAARFRMARTALRSRLTPPLLLLTAAASLVACSSGSTPAPPKSAPIVGNGRHYTVSGAQVPRGQWPGPCSLLPRSSGAAAVGTPVTIKRFHESCFYNPRSASFPHLTVTLQGVGAVLDSRYDALRQTAADRKPSSVANVGREAFIYTAKVQPQTTLVVLSTGALFSVSLTIPQGASQPAARTRATLVAVAKAIAEEFSS
jgi:hypothetical protein